MSEKVNKFMSLKSFKQAVGMDTDLEWYAKPGKTPMAFTPAGTVFASAKYSEKKPTFIMLHAGESYQGVDKSHLKDSLWACNSDMEVIIPSTFKRKA